MTDPRAVGTARKSAEAPGCVKAHPGAGGTRAFVVPGKPSPKARARTMKSGVTFTPKPTQLAESKVLECYLAEYHTAPPLDCAVHIDVLAAFEPAASWSKKRTAASLAGIEAPVSRPDLDNIVKLVTDALNGVAYKDDSQIISIRARKVFAPEAALTVTLHEASASDMRGW